MPDMIDLKTIPWYGWLAMGLLVIGILCATYQFGVIRGIENRDIINKIHP